MAAPRIQSVWGRVILAFVALTVLANAAVLSYLVVSAGPDGPDVGLPADELDSILSDPERMIDILLIHALAGILITFIMVRAVDRRPLADLGFGRGGQRGAGEVGWGFILGTALASAVALFISAVAARHVRLEMFAGSEADRVGALVLVLITAAFMEEWFFRGYLFTNLVEVISPRRTILLTALAFAAIHGTNPGASAMAWMNVLLVGIVLGQLRVVTGGIHVPFGLHMGWNLSLGMVYGAQVSGLSLPSVLRVSMEDLPPVLGGGEFGPEASVVLTVLFGGLAIVLARRSASPGGIDAPEV